MRGLDEIISDNKKAQREANASGRGLLPGKVQPGRKGYKGPTEKSRAKGRRIDDVKEELLSLGHPAVARLAKNLG